MSAPSIPHAVDAPSADACADGLPSASRGLVWIAAFAVSGTLYLATMAPGLLWGDSADAQYRVLTGALTDSRDLARAHVSYYLVARAMRAVTGMDAARCANVIAALAGAATVANMAVVFTILLRRRAAWVAATLMLLLSHTLWQMSCGAEVVTFSTMCLSAELACVIRYLQTRRKGLLFTAGFVNGFGWTTHNLALLTWPAYLVLVWRMRKDAQLPSGGTMLSTVIAWILGAAPLLVLAGSAFAETGDVAATIRSLLVGIYARSVFNSHVGGGMALRVVAYLVLNFPTPLLLLVPAGWWTLRRSAARGVWVFLTVAGATYAVFGARYKVADQYTFMVHAYLFLVVFAGVGLDRLITVRRSRIIPSAAILLAFVAPLLYAVAPSLVRSSPKLAARLPARELPYRDPLTWFIQPWRYGNNGADQYAREVLNALPQDAVLFADTTVRRPMFYLQAAESLRNDVRLGREAQRAVHKDRELDTQAIDRLIADGNLFSTTNDRDYVPDWMMGPRYTLIPDGLIYRAEMAPAGDANAPRDN